MRQAILDILKNFLVKYLPFIIIFLMSLFAPGDADLGWHLKYGEYFFKNGTILRANIFSLEMPDYRWVNSSWGIDLVTYSLFKSFGFLGIAIAGAIIITLIFFITDQMIGFSLWEKVFIFPLIYFLEKPLLLVSFRGQLLSLLGVAMILYLWFAYMRGNRKIIYLTIPLFLLWVNLHGGFLLGLSILVIFYILRVLKLKVTKSNKGNLFDWQMLMVIVLSFLVTLINPFGVEIYREIFKHFGNPYQKYIIEWIPLPPFSDLWWILIFWGMFLIINVRQIVSEEKFSDYMEVIGVITILYFLSHWMRRYAWTMYLVSIPIVTFFYKSIEPKEKYVKLAISLAILGMGYFWAVYWHIPEQRLTQLSWERYCQEIARCTSSSAEFLEQNKLTGKFLSFYNWGGWLIWNYPQIKPSIDGRMHLWRDEEGYSTFAKYYFLEQNIDDIDKSDYEIVYMSLEKPLYARLKDLVNQGKWKILYEDNLAGVFARAKDQSQKEGM